MNNQTRSEIEQAVGRQANPVKENRELAAEARETKIIGGHIGGIPKPKRSRFGIGWWFSGGIAALVAIVVLIPTPKSEPTPEPSLLAQLPKNPTANPIYQESRVPESGDEAASQNDELTSASDIERANAFRLEEQNSKVIDELSEKAKANIRKGQYTEPKDNNALKHYQEILLLEPNNRFAHNGVDYITNRFAVIGTKHIGKGQLDNAREALATLFSIDQNSEQYIELSDKITEYELASKVSPEQQAVENNLEKARKAIQRNHFTTPVGRNAFFHYQQVLTIEPDNKLASDGITSLAGRYVLMANEALKATDVEKAESYVATIAAITPEHPSLTLLTDRIIKANQAINQETLLEQELVDATLVEETLATENSASDRALDLSNEVDAELAQTQAETTISTTPATASTASTTSTTEITNTAASNAQNAAQAETPLSNANNGSDTEQITANTSGLDQATVDAINQALSATPGPESDQTTTEPITSQAENELGQTSSKELDEVRLENGLKAYYSGDYRRAIEYLLPLAEKNIARAQVRVGYMYYLGRGVNQDRGTGEEYLQRAMPAVTNFAQQNRAWAQADLGSLYEDGLIFKQDYQVAVEWYRKAADQGYAGAQTNLGNMYYGGRGVGQNIDTAINWFQRAAKNGDAVAKRNLVALGVNPI